MSRLEILLRVLLFPFVGLYALMFKTRAQKAAIRKEADRLSEAHRQREVQLDHYLDRRDAAIGEDKEMTLTETDVQDAQPGAYGRT